ncbi:hypothetical protein SLS62_007624 [Diatrype stigma]|uniref:Major facilitator superfamily (MFS) profile domain-containing protein n=1 Tax=Diatrype stigma TaxID=117547 RepID=A0AAN9ULK2_9PEZI
MARIEGILTEPEPDSVAGTGTSTPIETKEVVISDSDKYDVPATATAPLPPPPDGGLAAWTQVMGSWCVLFCTFGIVNTFGVYQAYYERTLAGVTSSDISWVGSIQGALLLCGGLISGPLFDAGYFRHLLYSGLLLIILGQFLTSLCTQFWQVVLAQGVCIGVGCGLVFGPCTAIIAQYFTTRRALASGVTSMGSPIAGIVLPIVFSSLEPRIGAPWATRAIAFILLGVSAVPLAFLRTRVPPAKHHRRIVDPTAFRDLPFLTFTAGGFFAFIALYIPFFYIELFTAEHRLAPAGFPPSYMVTLMNAGSVVGRLLPPYIADKTRQPALIMASSALLSAILAFAWLGIRHSFAGVAAFAVIYGAVSGGVVSMQSAGTFSLTRDMSKVGTRLGMTCFAAGIALLIGTPIAGVILGSGKGGMQWNGVIGFSADLLLVGTVFLFATVWFIWKENREARANNNQQNGGLVE